MNNTFEFDKTVDTVVGWFNQAPKEAQAEFLNTSKEGLCMYHHSLGRDIRNEFKLWENSWKPELDETGVDYSPNHPDAVSMKIIETVWDKLHEDT